MSGSSRFLLRWADLKSDQRLDVLADLGGVVYGDKVEGGDTELEGTIAYRRRLFDPLALDVSASGSWFRRDEQADGDPVFDQDLYGVESRLGWALGSDWVITGGGRYDWARYPGRELQETGEKEKQEQGTALLSCAKRFGSRDRVTLEFLYRRLESNEISSDFDGPTAVVRAKLSLPLRLNVTPAVVYGHRSFDSFLTEDSTDTRWDDSWQFGLSIVRSLSPRLSVFADGSYLHQVSNVNDFDFDESRVSAGFAFELVASRTTETVLTRPAAAKLAPQITEKGVVFRYRAPGARSVSVVGDWNGWTPGRHPLRAAKEGLWEETVPLKPGIWRYAFVIDGVWHAPPDAPRTEDDGFGGRQGILEIPPS